MKALKIIAVVLVVILVLLLLAVILLDARANSGDGQTVPSTGSQLGSGVLSWEAYQALSLEEQDAYFQTFDSAEAFEKWLESVRPVESTQGIPDKDWSGKKPDQYTWEEYEALSREEQEAFFLWFDSAEAFERWLEAAKPAETDPTEETVSQSGTGDNPGKTDTPGQTGKKPSDYTWAEYEALTEKEKDTFYAWFGSQSAFEAWMEKVKPEETEPTVPAWNKPGKTPDQYTWDEFQALSQIEQDAFYHWFDSQYAFEAWMEAAKPAETEPTVPVWNKPGKTPDQYTWDEFQALSQIEQDAFYHWFDSQYAFEAWMEAAKPAETEPTVPVWNKPGKTPDQYTWDEFQALTQIEQEAFYLWFDSEAAFESWMESVQ